MKNPFTAPLDSDDAAAAVVILIVTLLVAWGAR